MKKTAVEKSVTKDTVNKNSEVDLLVVKLSEV